MIAWIIPKELDQPSPRPTLRSRVYQEKIVYALILSASPWIAVVVSLAGSTKSIGVLDGSKNALVCGWVSVACLLWLSLMVVWVHWTYVRQRDLVESGVAAPVVVLKERETWGILGRRWRVMYEFEDEAGRRIRGRTTRLVPPWAEDVEPTLLYKADKPERHIWYPPDMVVCLRR